MLPSHENAANVSVTQKAFPLPVHMSDLELNDLFASCMPALKKAAMRMLRNTQDSEDILQEGLLSAVRNLHQFEGRSSFSTWLHSIVRNASRMYYRKSPGFHTTPINLASIEGSGPSEVDCVPDLRPSPEEAAIRQERSDILITLVRELPTRQQAAIESFYVQGLGERETSIHLGVTESALKAQLHRSRRTLTRRIRQVCLRGLRAGSFEPQTMFRVSAARRRSSRIKGIASNSTRKASIPCR